MAVKVTFINSPTNYNDPYISKFSDLESAVKKIVHNDKNYDKAQLIAVEEEGVGFHRVILNEKSEPVLGSWQVPSGGKIHKSEAYEKMMDKIREEYSKPKLA